MPTNASASCKLQQLLQSKQPTLFLHKMHSLQFVHLRHFLHIKQFTHLTHLLHSSHSLHKIANVQLTQFLHPMHSIHRLLLFAKFQKKLKMAITIGITRTIIIIKFFIELDSSLCLFYIILFYHIFKCNSI